MDERTDIHTVESQKQSLDFTYEEWHPKKHGTANIPSFFGCIDEISLQAKDDYC